MDKKHLLVVYRAAKKIELDCESYPGHHLEFVGILPDAIKAVEQELASDRASLNETLKILLNAPPLLAADPAVTEGIRSIVELIKQQNTIELQC